MSKKVSSTFCKLKTVRNIYVAIKAWTVHMRYDVQELV